MRDNEVIKCIQDLFFQSCKDLFENLDCNVGLMVDKPERLENCPIACIDGGSSDIEFKIALELPMPVLALTYPVGEGITKVEEDRLEDWISELSNQLIGRLKTKLIAHECFISIGLPATFFGANVDDLLAENSSIDSYYFDIDGEVAGCSISIEVYDEAMSFCLEANSHEEDQNEGELELF